MNCSMYCALKSSLHSLHISPNGPAIASVLSILSFIRIYHSLGGFPGSSEDKEYACKAGDPGLSQEVPLEKEMAIHSSILAWRIP